MVNQSLYEQRAQHLLYSQIGGDIHGFTSNAGTVFRYNVRTNEFATMKANGTIETLFRPKNGMTYYQTQVSKYGSN